jgi:hypothetical protein
MLCLSNHHLTGPVFAILEWTIIIDSYIKILVIFLLGESSLKCVCSYTLFCLQVWLLLLSSSLRTVSVEGSNTTNQLGIGIKIIGFECASNCLWKINTTNLYSLFLSFMVLFEKLVLCIVLTHMISFLQNHNCVVDQESTSGVKGQA